MTTHAWLGRLRRPVVVWAVTALVLELIVQWVLGGDRPMTTTVRTLVALSPLLPSLLFVLALARMVMHMDELQRLITLNSVFIAFVCTLTLTFVFAALDQAGARTAPWESIGTAMLALWAGAYVYSAWKYR